MRLYLIRHGETVYNRKRVMQGHGEVPLNDTGIEQAARLGRRMADEGLEHIYASDIRRAAMTAAILGAHTGTSITYHECFRERHPGELTGKSYEDTEPFFRDPTYHPKGGESVPQFAQRVQTGFEWLVEQEKDTDRKIAVVAHGLVCAAYMSLCIGMSLEELSETTWPNTCITIADYNGKWSLISQGDADHLEGMEPFIDHQTGA